MNESHSADERTDAPDPAGEGTPVSALVQHETTENESGKSHRGQVEVHNDRKVSEGTMTSIPNWIQAGAAVAIVIITFFYTRYAGQQAELMRGAVDAANTQAKAALAAAKAAQDANELTVQLVQASLGNFNVTPDRARRLVNWSLNNAGKLAATDVVWTAELTVESLSDGTIFQKEIKQSTGETIQPGSGTGSDFGVVEKISPDWGREAATIKVEVHYSAGFGKIITESFCNVLVADESVNGKGRDLYIGNPVCDKTPALIQRRREQLGLPQQKP